MTHLGPETSSPSFIRGIFTHQQPDLDAALSVWLLKRYGEERYPGISQVPVIFCSAGELPEGRSPESWEEEGWLVVDLAGGRLDNHTRADGRPALSQECASTLVARDLGVAERAELRKILQFSSQQDLEGRSIASKDPIDHAVALPNIIRGLNLFHKGEDARTLEVIHSILDGILAGEMEWVLAVAEVKKAHAETVASARLIACEGDSQALGKAARRRGADIVVQRHRPSGQAAITLQRQGVLAEWDLGRTAIYLRAGEAVAEDGGLKAQPFGEDDLSGVGMVRGWFLHTSRKILNKGSPKAPTVPPSLLTLPEMANLTAASLDPRRLLPPRFCPPDASCRGVACPLHSLDFPNCAGHRIRHGGASAADHQSYSQAVREMKGRINSPPPATPSTTESPLRPTPTPVPPPSPPED